jgi:hypothetical protein
MKFSIAAAVLVSTSAVGAFQPIKSASLRLTTRIRAIAIDPPQNIPAPTPEPPKKSNEPFDMSGIALSVSIAI